MILKSHLAKSSVSSDTNQSIIVYWMTLKQSDIYFVYSYVFVINEKIHVNTMYYSDGIIVCLVYFKLQNQQRV